MPIYIFPCRCQTSHSEADKQAIQNPTYSLDAPNLNAKYNPKGPPHSFITLPPTTSVIYDVIDTKTAPQSPKEERPYHVLERPQERTTGVYEELEKHQKRDRVQSEGRAYEVPITTVSSPAKPAAPAKPAKQLMEKLRKNTI